VRVAPGLIPLLERLRLASGGALALVSGRPLADLDALFAPLRLPSGGLHGMERRRADGTLVETIPPGDALASLRPALAAYAAARDGVLFEDKERTLALHYRLAPSYGASVRRFARRLRHEAADRLRLIEGKKVVEFQPLGCDKGRAIAAFLEEPPFKGRRPVFAGDDTTDEDGFAVVNERGGITLKVMGPHRAPLATAAHYTVKDVAMLHRWLAAVTDALEAAERPETRPEAAPAGTAAMRSALREHP
jgi:trehalose 6-phosphate phosphatase